MLPLIVWWYTVRIKEVYTMPRNPVPDEQKAQKVVAESNNEVFNETVAALVMLGFQKAASEKVVKALLKDEPDIHVEEAVRQALRRL